MEHSFAVSSSFLLLQEFANHRERGSLVLTSNQSQLLHLCYVERYAYRNVLMFYCMDIGDVNCVKSRWLAVNRYQVLLSTWLSICVNWNLFITFSSVFCIATNDGYIIWHAYGWLITLVNTIGSLRDAGQCLLVECITWCSVPLPTWLYENACNDNFGMQKAWLCLCPFRAHK